MDNILKAAGFLIIWLSVSALAFLMLGATIGEALMAKYKDDKEKEKKIFSTLAIISAFAGLVYLCAKGLIL